MDLKNGMGVAVEHEIPPHNGQDVKSRQRQTGCRQLPEGPVNERKGAQGQANGEGIEGKLSGIEKFEPNGQQVIEGWIPNIKVINLVKRPPSLVQYPEAAPGLAGFVGKKSGGKFIQLVKPEKGGYQEDQEKKERFQSPGKGGPSGGVPRGNLGETKKEEDGEKIKTGSPIKR
jgi:hypothetical protein